VTYEELRQASEEKDAAILELQQAAETVHTAVETEKKQVEGRSPLSLFCLLAEFVKIRSRLILRFHFQACGRLSGRQRPRPR
jgi:hypothetical protein